MIDVIYELAWAPVDLALSYRLVKPDVLGYSAPFHAAYLKAELPDPKLVS